MGRSWRGPGRDQGDGRLPYRRVHALGRRSEGLFPAIFGHEGAGVVVDVGAGVTSVAKATTSSRSTRRSAAPASRASRARPTSARRSAPRRGRA